MESNSANKDKKIVCRLCARENEKYFEIFGEQGVTWKIASIVSAHFWFEVNINCNNNGRKVER